MQYSRDIGGFLRQQSMLVAVLSKGIEVRVWGVG